MPGVSAPQRALHDGAVQPGASTAPGATPDQAGSHLTRPAAQHSPPRSTHSPARSPTRSPRRTRHVAPAAGPPPAAPHTSSPVHTAAAPTATSTDDTFDINTNIATVVENIPKMATDMWGKVAYVCAIAMTDTDVDRQVLGCPLWQLLPR